MNLFLQPRGRRRRGHDLQRARAGARDEEPGHRQLYTLDELNVIKMADLGTGTLEDGIFVARGLDRDEDEPGHRDAVPEGELQGLGLLPRQPGRVRPDVLDNGPTLGEGHQRWQMNEINALIWPPDSASGSWIRTTFTGTADIAHDYKIIKQPATTRPTGPIGRGRGRGLRDEDIDVEGEGCDAADGRVTKGGE